MRNRLRIALLCVAVVGTLVVAAPAQAINEWVCEGIPSAGFSDVPASSPHLNDINCLSYLEITSQVGTYDPYSSVSRWQMALFLTRAVPQSYLQVPGSSQGFTDIGALPADVQTAINQVFEFSITSGTTSTTFGPNDVVSRWQMALFLTRFVYAFGAEIPSGAEQGFTDTQALSAEAQVAINQVKQLGITTGTSATTYSPNSPVTREQMASFLIRSVKLITETLYFTPNCDPPLGEDGSYEPGIVCTGEATDFENDPFILRSSPFWVGPFDSQAEQDLFNSSRVEVLIDGAQQAVAERVTVLNGITFRHYVLIVPGLSGVHDIETRWFYNGILDATTIATVNYNVANN